MAVTVRAAACHVGGRSRMRAPTCAFALWLLLFISAGGAACAPDTVTVRSHPLFDPRVVTRVAVAPFRARHDQGVYHAFGAPPPAVEQDGIRRSLGHHAAPVLRSPRATPVSVPISAPDAVRRMVHTSLALNPRVHVIPLDTVGRVLLDGGEAAADDRRVRLLGQQLDVDAVIDGVIRVYRERDGTKFGAVPAAVGFEIRLLNAHDGRVFWRGDYFEEQQPLIQDVWGFIERGGVFVTAKELARGGVARVLQRLSLGKE